MLGFKSHGAADLVDRLTAVVFVVLVILFGIGGLVAFFFKSALFPV